MDIWAKTDRVKSFFRVGQISAEIKNSVASVDQLVERLQVCCLHVLKLGGSQKVVPDYVPHVHQRLAGRVRI
jgi:hypothetical protein